MKIKAAVVTNMVAFSLLPVASYAAAESDDTQTEVAAPAETAQADAQTESMDTIVVTGDWFADPKAEKVVSHSGARTIVDRVQLDEKGTNNIRDALNQIPGVQAQESNGTSGSDMSLNFGVRGLTARMSPRSTVLMDGVPLAYAPYGGPQLSIFPMTLGNVQSIDVMRGAGSVRYGPQNVGGIINFQTRPIPEDFAITVADTAEITGHNGNVKHTPTFFIGGTNDNGFGGAIIYSGIHGDGYRDDNDTTDIDDILVKTKYTFSDTDSIALNYHHFEGESDMPGGLTAQQYRDNPFQSVRNHDNFAGHRDDVSLRYLHDDGVNNVDILAYYVDTYRTSDVEQPRETGTGKNKTGGKYDPNNDQYRLTQAPRNFYYFGFEPRYSRLFVTGSVFQEVGVGYRYLEEHNAEVSKAGANYTRPSIDRNTSTYQTTRGQTRAHAFYIDDKIEFGDWTVTPGIRYETITTENHVRELANGAWKTKDPEMSYHEWLPTLAVNYRVNDEWSLFANGGVSFGPLQYNQLADDTDGLNPEKATTYELGTHYQGDNLRGELTLFYIDFSDELFLDRTKDGRYGNGQWTNLGATEHQGIELGLSYDFNDLTPVIGGLLTTSMTYAYTDASNAAGANKGDNLTYYSQHMGTLAANYAREAWNFNANMVARSNQDSPAKDDGYNNAAGRLGNIPGYAIFNLRGSYTFAEVEGHKTMISFGVNNIFDKENFIRSDDNNGGMFMGQPRTFYVGASLAM